MSLIARIAPGTVIGLVTFVCALPWGGPGELRLVLPLLPYVVIHCAVERWGKATPDWLVFLAGFTIDVAGQGPLGYWSFIYLCGYTMVRSSTAGRSTGWLSSIALFALTIVSLGLMQWSVASIYYLRSADVAPLTVAALAALGAYLLALLLLPAERTAPARINSRLERGL